MTTAQEGGKIVSLTHRPHLPPGNSPGTHFCQRLSRHQCGQKDYVNEKFQLQGGLNMTGTVTGLFTHKQSRSYLNDLVHHLESNQRPSDLQHSTLTTVPPRSPSPSLSFTKCNLLIDKGIWISNQVKKRHRSFTLAIDKNFLNHQHLGSNVNAQNLLLTSS